MVRANRYDCKVCGKEHKPGTYCHRHVDALRGGLKYYMECFNELMEADEMSDVAKILEKFLKAKPSEDFKNAAMMSGEEQS